MECLEILCPPPPHPNIEFPHLKVAPRSLGLTTVLQVAEKITSCNRPFNINACTFSLQFKKINAFYLRIPQRLACPLLKIKVKSTSMHVITNHIFVSSSLVKSSMVIWRKTGALPDCHDCTEEATRRRR